MHAARAPSWLAPREVAAIQGGLEAIAGLVEMFGDDGTSGRLRGIIAEELLALPQGRARMTACRSA